LEAEEKLEWSRECIEKKAYADGIYNAYAAFIHSAKALLLQQGVQCNTQAGILKDFDTHFTQNNLYTESDSFKETVLQMNNSAPSEEFAISYLRKAKDFIEFAKQFRERIVLTEKEAV
jgi:sulfite reductase (ferredoxin)